MTRYLKLSPEQQLRKNSLETLLFGSYNPLRHPMTHRESRGQGSEFKN